MATMSSDLNKYLRKVLEEQLPDLPVDFFISNISESYNHYKFSILVDDNYYEATYDKLKEKVSIFCYKLDKTIVVDSNEQVSITTSDDSTIIRFSEELGDE